MVLATFYFFFGNIDALKTSKLLKMRDLTTIAKEMEAQEKSPRKKKKSTVFFIRQKTD